MNQNKNIISLEVFKTRRKVEAKTLPPDYSPELYKVINAIKIDKAGNATLNLDGFPWFMPQLVFCYCAWNNSLFEVVHKDGIKKESASESMQRELARRMNWNLTHNRYAMKERPTDMYADNSNWPFNVTDLDNWLIVFDTDCKWKEVGDYLITRYNIDVTKLGIEYGGHYFKIQDMRDPNYWKIHARTAFSSFSHQVFFVRRDDEDEVAS